MVCGLCIRTHLASRRQRLLFSHPSKNGNASLRYAPLALMHALEGQALNTASGLSMADNEERTMYNTIQDLAREEANCLSLKQLYVLGKDPEPAHRLANAQFLHKELPVRLSQRAVELMNLPHGLSDVPGVQQVNHRPGWSGIIQSEVSPSVEARHSAAAVRSLCTRHLGAAPEIRIFGKDDATFTYVPSHLEVMLSEQLKNACRAVVTVAMGKFDVTMKIADEGGGASRSEMDKLWTYYYTTANKFLVGSPSPQLQETRSNRQKAGGKASAPGQGRVAAEHPLPPLAGFGLGLPLSRVYARYFGGDVLLKSMEGFGMDRYDFRGARFFVYCTAATEPVPAVRDDFSFHPDTREAFAHTTDEQG
eukprot:jgi/Undpi1/13194/HiC_scaffold_8.g02856.m1